MHVPKPHKLAKSKHIIEVSPGGKLGTIGQMLMGNKENILGIRNSHKKTFFFILGGQGNKPNYFISGNILESTSQMEFIN